MREASNADHSGYVQRRCFDRINMITHQKTGYLGHCHTTQGVITIDIGIRGVLNNTVNAELADTPARERASRQ